MAFLGLFRPFLQDIKSHGGLKRMLTNFQAPTFRWNQIFTVFFLAVLCVMMVQGSQWNFDRSEEHTSELQSLMRSSYAVFCLKKKHQLLLTLSYQLLINI